MGGEISRKKVHRALVAAFRFIGTWDSMDATQDLVLMSPQLCDEEKTFKVTDLPPSHRIIKWGYGERMDCVTDRLKVYLNADNVVTQIMFG